MTLVPPLRSCSSPAPSAPLAQPPDLKANSLLSSSRVHSLAEVSVGHQGFAGCRGQVTGERLGASPCRLHMSRASAGWRCTPANRGQWPSAKVGGCSQQATIEAGPELFSERRVIHNPGGGMGRGWQQQTAWVDQGENFAAR